MMYSSEGWSDGVLCSKAVYILQWVKGRLAMRRYQILFLLLCLSLGYLLIQFTMLHSVNKDVLHSFLTVCAKHGVKVMIFEPLSVRQYLRGDGLENIMSCDHCEEFGRYHTTVAIQGTQKLTAAMISEAGLQVHEVIVTDPRVETVGSLKAVNITGHFFVQQRKSKSHIIHVVVFYERRDASSTYIWHSPVRWSDAHMPVWLRQVLKIEDLTFGETASAFDLFQTVTVKEDGFELLVPENLLEQIQDSEFIECNITQAREFYKNHKQLQDDKFVHDAKTVMLKGREILNKLEVRFWLSSGNCLGWFRQCGIIPYSQDVDFGIRIEDNDDRIVPAFQGAGFTLKHLFGKVSDSYELSFIHVKTGIKLDLFFFYEEPDYMWNGGTEYRTGKKYKYIFPKFTLCWTDLLEMKFHVPCETESYVEANYGKNWIEPVTSWNWKEDPPNVRENGVWPESEWDKVIQIYDNVKQNEDIGLNFNQKQV